MKNSTIILLLILFSCSKKVENKTETKIDSIKIENQQIVGNDTDENGCKPSAGYTWSALKNECVQVFNVGTRLNHTVSQNKSYSTSAFVIFDKNKAELFLDNDSKPFILEQKSADKPWINGDWELSLTDSNSTYLLKNKGEILYTSK